MKSAERGLWKTDARLLADEATRTPLAGHRKEERVSAGTVLAERACATVPSLLGISLLTLRIHSTPGREGKRVLCTLRP